MSRRGKKVVLIRDRADAVRARRRIEVDVDVVVQECAIRGDQIIISKGDLLLSAKL